MSIFAIDSENKGAQVLLTKCDAELLKLEMVAQSVHRAQEKIQSAWEQAW
jgi:hypothetical protein